MTYIDIVINKHNKQPIKNSPVFFEYLENLIAALSNNGQVLDSTVYYTNSNSKTLATLLVPDTNSLSNQHNNVHVNLWLDNISKYFGSHLKFIFKSKYFDKSTEFLTNISRVKDFYLKWGSGSSILSLRGNKQVPFYYLPKTSADKSNYENIIYWNRNYEAIYRLWRRGEVMEKACYSQIFNINSELNKQGLLITEHLRTLTGKNFYYFLLNNNSSAPEKVCPKCKSQWTKFPHSSELRNICRQCYIVC